MIGFWVGFFLAIALFVGVLIKFGSIKLDLAKKRPAVVSRDPVDTAEGLTRYIELVNRCRTDAHLDKLINLRADGHLPTRTCECGHPSCALATDAKRKVSPYS